MIDQHLSALISLLRFANQITPLEKDILDTWDALQKKPFDAETAQKQIISNNIHYPELLAAISIMPNVIQKPFHEVTQEDMIFNLHCQLTGLVAEEMGALINGDHT